MTGLADPLEPTPGPIGRTWLRIKRRAAQRWPTIRRTLPRDLVILLWLGILAQYFSLGWVMTDSVHTTLAIVIRDASPKQGELAVFRYEGGSIPGYRDPDSWSVAVQRALGGSPDTDGPKVGAGFIKYLWGVPGDKIEVEGARVYLTNAKGRWDMGECKPKSRRGAELQPIQPGVIPEGYVYMWAPHPDALDSRYSLMGLVPVSALRGKAVPLW